MCGFRACRERVHHHGVVTHKVFALISSSRESCAGNAHPFVFFPWQTLNENYYIFLLKKSASFRRQAVAIPETFLHSIKHEHPEGGMVADDKPRGDSNSHGNTDFTRGRVKQCRHQAGRLVFSFQHT